VYDASLSATSHLPGPLAEVDFYPNPCHNQLNILGFESINADHFDAAIYTPTGQLLTRTSLDRQPMQVIPVDQIRKGEYVFKLTTDQQSVSKMFVKE
jgi:Secretion system C-terminal sorting domain